MREELRRHLEEGERRGARYVLDASRRTLQGAAGPRLGARSGSSLEFQDHREYQPGDDLRWVDWSAFARSDRLVVKRFHEEVFPHLDLVLDGSRSMALEGSAKARAALGLAALFAVAAENAGFSRAAWITREGCERVANGTEPPRAWDGIELDAVLGPPAAFRRLAPAFRPQGMRVLLSDLLFGDDPEPFVALLARGASSVVVVQVLARADRDPAVAGAVRLVDSETGEIEDVLLDDGAVRRYSETLGRHQEAWNRAARRAGARLVTLVAEDVAASWSLEELLETEILSPR